VSFYAIGIDPYESMNLLIRYKEEQGYPWPVATAPPGMLPAYRIVTQSSKVAIGRDGVITFRAGYGQASRDTWVGVFEELAAG
jgi:hypothetical protein